MWSVQVTGILIVLNPAAWTAETIDCVVSGFPQLVSLGLASNVFPRFHPGDMALTICCGERPPRAPPSPPPASELPELEAPPLAEPLLAEPLLAEPLLAEPLPDPEAAPPEEPLPDPEAPPPEEPLPDPDAPLLDEPRPDPDEPETPDELPDELPAPEEAAAPASVVCAAPSEEPHAVVHTEAPIKPHAYAHGRMDRMLASRLQRTCRARLAEFLRGWVHRDRTLRGGKLRKLRWRRSVSSGRLGRIPASCDGTQNSSAPRQRKSRPSRLTR
jgi:hypothetical protein